MICKSKIVLVLSLFILQSCSQNKKAIEFVNKDFEAKLIRFINKSDVHYSSVNYILVYIMKIKNQNASLKFYSVNPFECAYFLNSIDYKGKTILFYSNMTIDQRNSLYKINGPSDLNCENIVDKEKIDLPYQVAYEIRNGKIFRLDELYKPVVLDSLEGH